MRRLRSWLISLALIGTILIAACVFARQNVHSTIEKRIISAANQSLSAEGQCDIDLGNVFADFEWDTVSVFVGGNSRQIRDSLQVDSDISDGIVFSDHGKPVMVEMSTYGFPEDVPPDVGYYVERIQADDPYFVGRPREDAVIHVKKFRAHNGKYKYLIYFE